MAVDVGEREHGVVDRVPACEKLEWVGVCEVLGAVEGVEKATAVVGAELKSLCGAMCSARRMDARLGLGALVKGSQPRPQQQKTAFANYSQRLERIRLGIATRMVPTRRCMPA